MMWTSMRHATAHTKHAFLFLLPLLFLTTTLLEYYEIIHIFNKTTIPISSRKLEAIKRFPSTPFPRSFYLEPVADVPLPKSAFFISCVKRDNNSTDLTCSFREHHRNHIIGRIVLDGRTFRIKSTILRDAVPEDFDNPWSYSPTHKSLTENVLYGEDPRSFIWEGEHYVLTYYDEMKYSALVQVAEDGTVIREVNLPSTLREKHLTPVPVTGTGLMFIDFEEDKIHVCIRTESETTGLSCEPFWKNIVRSFKGQKTEEDEHKWSYRGGSPGIEARPGLFVGFGHSVLTDVGKDGHRHNGLYHWRLDVRPEVAQLFIDRPPIKYKLDFGIRRPSGMIEVGGGWYLFTTESEMT